MGPKKKDKKDDGDGEEGGGKKYGSAMPAPRDQHRVCATPSRLRFLRGGGDDTLDRDILLVEINAVRAKLKRSEVGHFI